MIEDFRSAGKPWRVSLFKCFDLGEGLRDTEKMVSPDPLEGPLLIAAPVMTLHERALARKEAMSKSLEAARPLLRREAARLGGRFILYGSMIRGDFRPDSDLDIILDFPTASLQSDAWDSVEAIGSAVGLMVDPRPVRFCETAFLTHIFQHAEIVS